MSLNSVATVAYDAIHSHNSARTASNQTYIGVLFFLVALGMVLYVIGVALVQAYVLPMRRFEHVWSKFASTKFVALIYAALLCALYFLISTVGGMTGFIVSSSVLLLWLLALVFVGTIRRWIRAPNAPQDAEPSSPASAADAASKPPTSVVARTPSKRVFVFRRLKEVDDPWTSSPTPMDTNQLVCIFLVWGFLLLTVSTLLLIVYAWSIPDYWVVDRDLNPVAEITPPMTAKALQFAYAYPEVARKLQLDVYTKLFTEYCGVTFTQTLESDADRITAIQNEWVNAYQVNMSLFVRTSALQYTSVNDWFTREINMKYRPLANGSNTITSPADCRMTTFANFVQARQWFKGYTLDQRTLTNNAIVNGDPKYFANGILVIARLAPSDYHRFHAPVNGTVTSVMTVPGTLWSVSADAVGSGNDVFLNQRTVVIIDAGAKLGFVAFVAIGATCVGSVVLQDANGMPIVAGTKVVQGQQLGYFQFGGSTIALLFGQGAVTLDSGIAYGSTFPVETLVLLNQRIGSY